MIALRECRNVLSGAPQRRTADLHVSQKKGGKEERVERVLLSGSKSFQGRLGKIAFWTNHALMSSSSFLLTNDPCSLKLFPSTVLQIAVVTFSSLLVGKYRLTHIIRSLMWDKIPVVILTVIYKPEDVQVLLGLRHCPEYAGKQKPGK